MGQVLDFICADVPVKEIYAIASYGWVKLIGDGERTFTYTGWTDTHSSPSPSPAEGFPLWIIGIAVVAIGTAVATIVLLKKRKKFFQYMPPFHRLLVHG